MSALFFQAGNLLVLPLWLLMIFAPGWRGTQRVLRSPWIVAPLAFLYGVLVLPDIARILPPLLRPELPVIASLLGSAPGTTVAWLHFLAFDLWVGRWVYLDGRQRSMPLWVSAPTLFFVLMLGPVGWLVHMLMRQHWAPASAGGLRDGRVVVSERSLDIAE